MECDWIGVCIVVHVPGMSVGIDKCGWSVKTCTGEIAQTGTDWHRACQASAVLYSTIS